MTDACQHDHSEPTPEQEAAAREVQCVRCGEFVIGAPSQEGTVMIQVYVPTSGFRTRTQFCGACGLLFREFLSPTLLDDPQYQAIKRELQSRWG